MPMYSISGPDGRTYSIEGPEGATREQVISAIQARLAEQPVETVAPAPIPPKESTIGGEFRRGYLRFCRVLEQVQRRYLVLLKKLRWLVLSEPDKFLRQQERVRL